MAFGSKGTRLISANGKRIYEDFEPSCKWQGSHTLEIHLPGFKKEQLQVRVSSNGMLSINGERVIEGSKVINRFRKEMKVPKDVGSNQIRAKFCSSGVLLITISANEDGQSTNDEDKGSTQLAPLEEETKQGFEVDLLRLMKKKKKIILGAVEISVVIMLLVGAATLGTRLASKYYI